MGGFSRDKRRYPGGPYESLKHVGVRAIKFRKDRASYGKENRQEDRHPQGHREGGK